MFLLIHKGLPLSINIYYDCLLQIGKKKKISLDLEDICKALFAVRVLVFIFCTHTHAHTQAPAQLQ